MLVERPRGGVRNGTTERIGALQQLELVALVDELGQQARVREVALDGRADRVGAVHA